MILGGVHDVHLNTVAMRLHTGAGCLHTIAGCCRVHVVVNDRAAAGLQEEVNTVAMCLRTGAGWLHTIARWLHIGLQFVERKSRKGRVIGGARERNEFVEGDAKWLHKKAGAWRYIP